MQIVGVDKAGVHYTLNHLYGDNAEVEGARGEEAEQLRKKLLTRCQRMVMAWRGLFPDDTITIINERRFSRW
jgi:hypothetical protein